MSNQETTITLGQHKRRGDLALEAHRAKNAESDYNYEIELLNSFQQRVEAGEFSDVDHARRASALVFDVDPSQETKGALEAFLTLDRDWTALNKAFKQGLKAAIDAEKAWAEARENLIGNLNQETNGYARNFSLEIADDGSATLPAEAVKLLTICAYWADQGKIGKVSTFVNSTPSGALSLRFKINNPAKVKG